MFGLCCDPIISLICLKFCWGAWKFWREARGLLWRGSIRCKDSSGLVGFDWDGFDLFMDFCLNLLDFVQYLLYLIRFSAKAGGI